MHVSENEDCQKILVSQYHSISIYFAIIPENEQFHSNLNILNDHSHGLS